MFRIFSPAAFAALLLVSTASPAASAGPADPPAAFGAREAVLDIALSPSGGRVAFIAPGPGRSTLLYTVDVGGEAEPFMALSADGKPERLSNCGWVSEQRLICTVYMVVDTVVVGQPLGATRLVAVNADGTNVKLVSRRSRSDDLYVAQSGGDVIDWQPGNEGSILMGRQYVPEAKIGTHVEDKREGYGVDRIDTASLSSKSVEPAKQNASDYISDGRGNIRIMAITDVAGTGYASGKINYYYRTKTSRDWKQLGTVDNNSNAGFYPVAVDPDLDVAYGFKQAEGGRQALYSVALDGSKKETLVFAHPQVDVGSTVRIGRGHRVVGATYALEKREAVYFDPTLAALGKSLSKALPGLPLIRFVDSSADESKLLLWAGSDTDSGRYYLYDKGAKQLGELMHSRPPLESAKLATVKPVRYKAADGTEVPAYLTLPPGSSGKNLPALVMPHGGPSSRDEWGFDWLAQFFANRGYAVLQPNYRGSSGYGDSWYKKNGFQSWRTAIGDVNDAGRWLVSQGIADPARLAVVGWSYGGYAALQSEVLDPGLYRAVVAVAPVTDLAALVKDSAEFTNYRVVRSFIGAGPHIKEGSPAQNAAKIKVPVLLFHGDMDLNVGINQSRMMQDRLKAAGAQSELVVYNGLDHQLEDSLARADMLRRSDAFLRKALAIQ
ncbi:MAG TPA: S9 family peptidase [Allosphingosinicella sp.]|jgi:dipeptidyl aminopeptidase/acylaminoacyl peptidase